jgi:hypothetical protein
MVTALEGGFLEDPALRFALNARPVASQGSAAAGVLQKRESQHFAKIAGIKGKNQEEASAAAGETRPRWGQMRVSKGAKSS